MKNILIALILLSAGFNCFSQEKQLNFADRTSLEVTNASSKIKTPNSKTAAVPQVSTISKEFTASLTGIGKAVPPLDERALKKFGEKNKSLAAQIKNIDSAYNLAQNGTEYYFAGLNSIASDKFSGCSPDKPCEVKCRAIIVRLTGKTETENVLILRSFELIK